MKNTSTLLGYSLAFMLPAFVEATTFNVAAGDVYGPQGLVAAINAANQIGGENTIKLAPGIYTLNAVDNNTDGLNGLPSVQSTMTVNGAGADVTIIERPFGFVAPVAPAFRLIHVAASGTLNLSALTLQGGNFAIGGGLFNSGSLTLDAVTLQRNFAASIGGGLYNLGQASLENCLINENVSSVIAGGIYNEGQLSISSCSIEDNDGGFTVGGIINFGTLTLTRSTVTNNLSDNIGGLLNGDVAIITNSTFARNSQLVFSGGSAIDNGGFLTLTNSTMAHNESASIAGSGLKNLGGILTVQNSIIAHNEVNVPPNFPGPKGNCDGPIVSLGHNLFDPSGCTGISSFVTDIFADPGLGDFIDDEISGHGYFPLLPGSPAINAGDNTACPVLDQLELTCIGTCDIGSVEFQGSRLVSVDVRPRSEANRINPNSTRNINVAIFNNANGFDATTIEPNTVRFGATGTEAAPIRVAHRDVDGDGDPDIVMRFQIPSTGIRYGYTSAVLTG